MAGLRIFDTVSEWPNKTWIKFRRATPASIYDVGGGGILKTDSKIIRRKLDLSFQEGSKWFRHSVSKICYRARVSKDPDEVPKTEKEISNVK